MGERERPSVYIHFEFGVAWPRNASRNRHITYMSKSVRDKANQFPRQLPPPNTNFLAAPATFQFPAQQVNTTQPQAVPQAQIQAQIQAQTQTQQYHQQPAFAYCNHGTLNASSKHGTAAPQQTSTQQYYRPFSQTQPQPQAQLQHQQQTQSQPQLQQQQHLQPPTQTQPQIQNNHSQIEQVRRSSRSHSKSSHDRGKSAPPPFNSSPWDANADAGPSTSSREAQVWKALPPTPNQYRLGEDGMPWSSWTFPLGYEDNDDNYEEEGDGRRRPGKEGMQATWGPEYPPEPSRQVDVDDRTRGRSQEMQSLATALMTVDNGFEDQWWYQGSRLVNVTGSVLVPTAPPRVNDGTGGLHGVLPERETAEFPSRPTRSASFQPSSSSFQPASPRSSVVDIVSPMSDYPSPMSSFGGLRRSLTTRSDELHM